MESERDKEKVFFFWSYFKFDLFFQTFYLHINSFLTENKHMFSIDNFFFFKVVRHSHFSNAVYYIFYVLGSLCLAENYK